MKVTTNSGHVEVHAGTDVSTTHELPPSIDSTSPTVSVTAYWERHNAFHDQWETSAVTVCGSIMQIEQLAMALVREAQVAETALLAQANSTTTFDDGENW